MKRTLQFTVDEAFEGRRLKAFLRGRAGLSSRLMNTLKQQPDGMLSNGAPIRTIDAVHAGDVITLNLPGENAREAFSDITLDVVYEDDDILIINKPAGLAMHETHNHRGDTLANAVAGYLAKSGKDGVFRAVGRLDKDTSGLVVCALNAYSAAALSGKVVKTYLAIVEGVLEGSGTIDTPIYRPDPMKTLRAAGPGGERAVTHWTALGHSDRHTLVEVTLETGRTHQIRVHFSSLGMPLAGDEMYGGSREYIGRQALHCAAVELTHPVTGQKMHFKRTALGAWQRRPIRFDVAGNN